jgi:hypothetical protein
MTAAGSLLVSVTRLQSVQLPSGNELNNREWATLVWLGVVVVLVFWWKRTRQPVLNLVRSAMTSLLAVLVAGLWVWTAGIVVLGAWAHLWTGDLLKDTAIWAIGPALALIWGLAKAPTDPRFFRRVVLGTVKVSVLVECYMNLQVFGFVQELVLLPVVTSLAVLDQFAGTDQKYRPAKRLFDYILAGIGLAVLAYVTIALIGNWHQQNPLHDVRELALPVWLTIGALPYILGVSLFFNYECAFRGLAQSSKDVDAVRRAKLALLVGLNVRSHRVGAFYEPWITRLAEAHNFPEALNVVRQFLRGESAQTG